MNYQILKKIGYGIAITGGVISFGAVIPMAMGFGTVGIAASSAAAGIQSSIGNVAAGSLFAFFQSLGMSGFFLTTAGAGGAAAVACTAAAVGASYAEKKDQDKKK